MATLAPIRSHGARSDVVGIMLVDDHAIVRQGLRSILEREDDLRVVAEASSAAEALAVGRPGRPADRAARPQAVDVVRQRGPRAVRRS